MADWSHLPGDLLHAISTRLDSSISTLRFRSICSSWRSSVPPPLTPFPADLSHDSFSPNFGGFILSRRSIFLLSHPQTPLPWILKTEPGTSPGSLRLFNPMSRPHINPGPTSIDLSNIRVSELGQEFVLQYSNHNTALGGHYSNLYMEKVACMVLGDQDYALLTVHISGKLAVSRSGDSKWFVIADPEALYDDVVVFDGRFYAVEGSGRAVVVEGMAVREVAGAVDGGDRKCLVGLGEDLLLVDVHSGCYPLVEEEEEDGDGALMRRVRVRVRVFKLGGEGWVEVRSLGGHVLFLGDNCTFSVRAEDLPGCKGDCICLNLGEYQCPLNGEDGDGLRGWDIGVFSLEDGKVEPCETYTSYSKLFWPPPSWVASPSPEE